MPDGFSFEQAQTPQPTDLDSSYQEAGKRFDVDPNLLRTMTHVESGGNPMAVSDQNAMGLMQLLPDTYADMARKHGLSDDIFDQHDNIMAGAAYLRENFDRFKRPDMAIAAYHGGPDTRQWGPKTARYLDLVAQGYSVQPPVRDSEKSPSFPGSPAPPTPGAFSFEDAQQPIRQSAGELATKPFSFNEGIEGKPLTSKQTLATLPMAQKEELPAQQPPENPEDPTGAAAAMGWTPGPAPEWSKAIGSAIANAWQNTPGVLTPQAQSWLDKTGLGGVTRLVDLVNAGFSAGTAGGLETLNQIGGRHLAEIGESILMQTMGEAGTAHAPAARDARAEPRAAPAIPEPPEAGAAPVAPTPAPEGPTPRAAAPPPQAAPAEAMPTVDVHAARPQTAPVPAPAPTGNPMLDRLVAQAAQRNAARAQAEAPTQPEQAAGAEAHAELDQIAKGAPVGPAAGDAGTQAIQPPPAEPEPAPTAPVAQPSPVINEPPAPAEILSNPPLFPESESVPQAEKQEPPRAGRSGAPFEPVPREPTRLIEWLRRPTIQSPGTIHEMTIPGGLKDTGGDLKAILGGTRGRPGLINNKTGRSLDDAAQAAWEAGYLPGAERPDINALLDAIRDDHMGAPRYSEHDADAAASYHAAIEGNAEIERLASEHSIETRGKTREQFFDALHDGMSQDQWGQEIASQDAADEAAYREAEKQAKQWVAEHQGLEWRSDQFYGRSQARTLEEMEREYAEEAQPHPTAPAPGERAAGSEQPGPAGRDQGAVPQGGEPRAGGAGDAERGAPQDHSYAVGEKHNGKIPEIKYLPTDAIERRLSVHPWLDQSLDFRPEVTRVSDKVARNMDYSESVDATALRYSKGNSDTEPKVQLVDGHHRLAAALQTGKPFLPVNITARNAKGEKLNALIAMSREIERSIAEPKPADLLGRPVAEPRAKAQPEPTIRNDTRQAAMPGTEPSAVQAQAARDAQGRGALQSDTAQKPADEGLFAPDTSGQGKLYAGPSAVFDPDAWKRFFSPAAKRELPKQEPPGGMFEPPRGPPRAPTPPEIEAARMAVPAVTKNLNAIERYSIFPRTLAALDEPSAHFWNAWQRREVEASANADHLRQNIPTFLKLDRAGRDRVAAAMEVGRIAPEGLMAGPDGGMIVRNDTIPHARWSQVGDVLHLSPEESRAANELVKLGDEQWTMLQRAAAKRYGWGGDIDPERIRQAANEATEPGGHKQLNRLADLLDAMKQHQEDIYFPMQRHGSYFIAIRPKAGEGVVAAGGGHPPLAWFETVEKPPLQDVLGKTQGWQSVQQVAANRIAELRKQFPADRFDIQQGDFSRTPSLLRKMDIPAIEKLMMLMESSVQRGIRERVMSEEGGPTTAKGIRQEAKSRYENLHGQTIEAFYDALFTELKAGYRRKANAVPGYSADFDRALGTHLFQIARNSADMAHRDGIESAYTAIQDYHPHKSVASYWKDWRDHQDDPGNVMSRAANSISQVGFTYVLGMSPSSTMIMASHTPMAAAPVLSLGVGPRAAVPLLTRGLGTAYRSIRWDGDHGATLNLDAAMRGMSPDKAAFIQKMASEGKLAAVGAHDLGRLNERPSMLLGDKTGMWRRGLDIATSNVSAVDQANRFAVASAAWDIASDPKKLEAAARPLMQNSATFRDMVQSQGLSAETFGRFMLSEAAFDWGKANRAPWMRTWYGTLASSLHGFQTRYLSTAFRLMKNSGPEGKMAGLFMMGALTTGAGLAGLPFVQDVGNGADAIWRFFAGKNPSIGLHLRDFIQDNFGKAGASIMLDGPASYASGIDLGSRIGFGDVLSREMDSSNALGTIPSILWSSLAAAKKRMESGQPASAVASELVPYAARGPLRAAAASQQGIVTRGGGQTVAPEKMSQGDIARMATGFTPLSLKDTRREAERYYQAQEGLPAVTAKAKAGDIEGARADLRAMGWSPFRIKGFMRGIRRPPGESKQFQRFEQQRNAQP